MRIHFDEKVTSNLDEALTREWIETNGLGGWASSSLALAHTRRQHGLLMAALAPPAGRMLLLSKLDETLLLGEERVELGANLFPGAVHPRGFERLLSFDLDPFPTFTIEAAGVRLRKRIAAIHGENTVVVSYEILAAPEGLAMEFRPLVAFREADALMTANEFVRPDVSFDSGILRVRPYEGVPDLFIALMGSSYEPSWDWYYHFEYPLDGFEGQPAHEDLLTPGVLRRSVAAGSRFDVIVSTLDPAGRDGLGLLGIERERRRSLLDKVPQEDELARALALAADRFLVRSREGGVTIVSGYPWTLERLGDALAALPGVCLTSGRHDEAKAVLRTTLRAPLHETEGADALLWLYPAALKYLEATHDDAFVREEVLPVLRSHLAAIEEGEAVDASVDGDGLLVTDVRRRSLSSTASTILREPAAPRRGKAVDVNALWINALWIAADLEKRLGEAVRAKVLGAKAKKAKARFEELFWNEAENGLVDVVSGDEADASVRPNQILALGLPFPLLQSTRAKKVLQIVEAKLVTPTGLRTLAADEPGYRPRPADSGDWHRGVAWSWLLGPYVTALTRYGGPGGAARARTLLGGFRAHLAEAGLGSISAAFDAEPPHAPRGNIAHAWSVAEVFRAWVEEVLPAISAPVKTKAKVAEAKAVKAAKGKKAASARKPRAKSTARVE